MGKDARTNLRAVLDAAQQAENAVVLSETDFDRLKSKQCDVLQLQVNIDSIQRQAAQAIQEQHKLGEKAVQARQAVLAELADVYGFDASRNWTVNDDRTLTPA